MALDDLIEDIDEEPPEQPDKSIEDLIAELSDLVKHFQAQVIEASNRADPESLSKHMMRLARVNSALGRHAGYAKYVARNAEHAYKAARDQKKLDSMEAGKSGTYGDTQRYIKSSTEHKIWSDAQLIADQADDLCFRTDTFLKLSQSRLSLIKGDAARGR